MRRSTSVLLAGGQRLHFRQRAGESAHEFDGLTLCAIEAALTDGRGTLSAGTRWVEWWHDGHVAGNRFHSNGKGHMRESTGNNINRTRLVPGLFTEAEAVAALAALR